MPKRTPSSTNSAPPDARPAARSLQARWTASARESPAHFVSYCFTDADAKPLDLDQVHIDLQAFLSAHPRGLVELPRDHGKSVQVCGRILWELGHNPALRVKVVCATEGVAAERSRFLRNAIAKNERLRRVFPKLRPSRPWAIEAFTVKRPADVIGPSVAAFGVGAGSTGTRADLLVCDDVVDVRALSSKADRDRVRDAFQDNLLNLLEPDGRFWGLCTPWHADDLNAHLKRNPAFALFRRAVGPDLEPVWPKRWPREKLEARRREIGAASFARGYRLVPIADEETPIRPAWVRTWDEPVTYDRVILSVDPAVASHARADCSALVVLGRVGGGAASRRCQPAGGPPDHPPVDTGGSPGVHVDAGRSPGIHVLEATARRVPTPELVALIDAADRRWNPDVILFESNAAFAGLRDLLARTARFGPKLKGVTQTADKASRVAALSVPVENGAVRLKGDGGRVDAGQRALLEEMTTFPFAEHDDLLDALGTGVAYLLDRREPRAW